MLIAQITDLHITAKGSSVKDRIDTAETLRRAIAHLNALPTQPDLVVITGDLTEDGHPAEFDHLKELLLPLRPQMLLLPGNHDDRQEFLTAFAGRPELPEPGDFAQFAADFGSLRIIGLDSTEPGHHHASFCPARAAWLEEKLAESPSRPTLIGIHHPPFQTGIGWMDLPSDAWAEPLERIVAKNAQIIGVISGHLHRPISTIWAGRPALTAPSTAHQVALHISDEALPEFTLEPPGYMLHWWNGTRLVSHVAKLDTGFEQWRPYGDDLPRWQRIRDRVRAAKAIPKRR